MAKNYNNAYQRIKDKAIELRDKVLGPDRAVILPKLPDYYNNTPATQNFLENYLISLKPYKDEDTSGSSLAKQALQMEITNAFNDAEQFYIDVTGSAPNYE